MLVCDTTIEIIMYVMAYILFDVPLSQSNLSNYMYFTGTIGTNCSFVDVYLQNGNFRITIIHAMYSWVTKIMNFFIIDENMLTQSYKLM